MTTVTTARTRPFAGAVYTEHAATTEAASADFRDLLTAFLVKHRWATVVPVVGRAAVRTMEAWLRARGGYQCMYAVTEQTRAQFWQMFGRTLYDQARKKYGAEGAFMDVFDKVKRPEQA